jgi:hypothetical protein
MDDCHDFMISWNEGNGWDGMVYPDRLEEDFRL